MARSCCSTRRPCSVDPTCAPARRRCGGGWPPRPWPDRPATAAPSSSGRPAAWPLCRRCCGGTPLGTPPGSWHDRTELGFPPATRLASITGPPAGVADLIAAADLPAGAELLGPVPLPEDRERLLVRVSRPAGAELARALGAAQAIRSARKAPEPVRVELDPLELF